VRLQFVDILGLPKNVSIPVSQLGKALDDDVLFDGSSIQGFVRIEESDMLLRPDTDTFAILPWRPRENAVARLICDVLTPDGKPFEGDPRNVLKKQLEKSENLGYTMYVGSEPEFFIFELDKDGKPTTKCQDQGGYFDFAPQDKGENSRREMVLALEEMGIEIEAAHHEVAPGQHEIDFKYDNALKAADTIMTFKLVLHSVAAKMGLHVSFMPKPIAFINGSGMHCHQSLFRGDKNVFFDPDGPRQISELAYHYIAGLLEHAPAITAICNPTVNSYKRLVPGYEAPTYIAWSEKNRSPLIRVPARRGLSTRCELRSPDPTCNPYLAYTVMLAAGLDGISRKLEPPKPVEGNIYEMTDSQLKRNKIGQLPSNLEKALDALEKDRVICDALSDHSLEHFLDAKRAEWEEYRMQVNQWELDKYLSIY